LPAGAVESRRRIVFGAARFPLVGRDKVIDAGGPADVPPAQLDVVGASGARHRFSRFAPCVQYSIQDGTFDHACLRLSLQSLERHGRYRGMIGIVSDRPGDAFLSDIPPIFHDRFIVRRPGADPDERARPILLCSPDVIFDADIVDILIDALLRNEQLIPARSVAHQSHGEMPAARRGLTRFHCSTPEATEAAMRSYLLALDAAASTAGDTSRSG
jgi:hypothetical protein